MKLGGPQTQPACCADFKTFPLPASERQFLVDAARSTGATMSELSQLPSGLLLPSVQYNPA